jgi:hypothetical protein
VSGGKRADLIELEAICNRLDSISSAYVIKIYQ